ncbi:MAG: LamG domain-containing protein [Bacteroides sp.]|nr:LamG domain-containing protein [Bacteroides sp.]
MSRRAYYIQNRTIAIDGLILDIPMCPAYYAGRTDYEDRCGHEMMGSLKQNYLPIYNGTFALGENKWRGLSGVMPINMIPESDFPYWAFEKGTLAHGFSLSFLLYGRGTPNMGDYCWELCSIENGKVSPGIVYFKTPSFNLGVFNSKNEELAAYSWRNEYVEKGMFVTVTFAPDGGTCNLYINGALVGSKPNAGVYAENACGLWPLSESRKPKVASYGAFRQIKLFNRELAAEEIGELFQAEWNLLP